MRVHHRINAGQAIALILSAAAVDFLQLVIILITLVIPLLGGGLAMILTLFAHFVFATWFTILRVETFSSPPRLFVKIGTRIIEILPYMNALPMWTIYITYIVWHVRREDKKNSRKYDDEMFLDEMEDASFADA